MERKIILSTKGLCKSYASEGTQNHVLNGIDLDIYEGDFTIIMGASGSGKSTLLYCLSGMDRATAGAVLYEGKDIAKFNENKLTRLRHGDFGFVFQQIHLVSNLNMFENVAVPGYLGKKRTAPQVNKYAQELLKKMGIYEAFKRLPSQVSGGEAQRAAIARALINDPKLLFADEPTGALNKRTSREVLDLLTAINNEGQSVLMVTHDIRAAVRGSRIIYLEDGKVLGELSLPGYKQNISDEEFKSREKQVNAWLSSMSW